MKYSSLSRYTPLYIVALLVMALLPNVSVLAQTPKSRDGPKVRAQPNISIQKYREMLSTTFKQPENSQFVGAATQEYALRQAVAQGRQVPATNPKLVPVEQDLPILKHLRGKQGIALPPKEDLLKRLPDSAQSESFIEEKINTDLQRGIDSMMNPEPLPACSSSETKITKLGELRGTQQSQLSFDMLFIREEQLSVDPREVYGQGVVVVPIRKASEGVDTAYARGARISCLPSRVRITSVATYLHEGKDAIRNYDKKIDSTGELDGRALKGWRAGADGNAGGQ